MADSHDEHNQPSILDHVDDPEITGSDPVEILAPFQLSRAIRPGVFGQRIDPLGDADLVRPGQRGEFLGRSPRELDGPGHLQGRYDTRD